MPKREQQSAQCDFNTKSPDQQVLVAYETIEQAESLSKSTIYLEDSHNDCTLAAITCANV